MIKDSEIVDRIKEELKEKMQPSALDINVDSKQGNVILSGLVDVLSKKNFAKIDRD